MEDYKYCTKCNTEYYAHITECARCGIPVKTTEEIENEKKKEQYTSINTSTEVVSVRDGSRAWIEELYNHLESTGFPCKIVCNPGCCGGTYQLIVPASDVEAADLAIEKYNHEVHPELKASFENASQGKCPACGFDVAEDVESCPECSLMLVFKDEEE